MYVVLQQEGPGDRTEIFADESPKLALAVSLRPPEGYEFLSAAFPGNPPEKVDLDSVSLDYLVAEIESGRLFNVSFRRPDDERGGLDKYQSVWKI